MRRSSVAVALSSPRAPTQILSGSSPARCLTLHRHQVQSDTETPVCLLPPGRSARLRGHVRLSAAQLPHVWSITPSASMIVMNPPAFYRQSIIEQPLKELSPRLREGGARVAEFTRRVNWKLWQTGCSRFAVKPARVVPLLGVCIKPNPVLSCASHTNTRPQPFLAHLHFHLIRAYRAASDYY